MSAALTQHRRIVVIGSSGAGKTTFARQLALILACEHIELDSLYWGPRWTQRADFVDRVRAAVADECWVAEGNYSVVRDQVWGRATALVWLNYSFPVVFGRALWRTLGRVLLRETIYAGNRESLMRALFDPEGVPWWIIRTYRRRRREYPALFASPRFGHLAVFEARSPAEGAALLTDAEARRPDRFPYPRYTRDLR
jgi:adenylate kinase family enzyme